jgi:putative ABC transport system permease protein
MSARMGASGALWLRGARWRLGLSLLTVLTSAIAVGAAVLGPLYLHTAGDSVVRTTVVAAPVDARGVTLLSPAGGLATIGQIERAEDAFVRAVGQHGWFGRPITTVITAVGLTGPAAAPFDSELVARTGICSVLHFQSGGCDPGPGDVAISSRTAGRLKLSLGAVIPAAVRGEARPVRLRVTGIYAVPNTSLPYWWGNGASYFPFGQTTGPNRIPELDSMVTSPATALDVPVQSNPDVTGQLPLRAGLVGIGDESSIRQLLARVTSADDRSGVALSTRLAAILDAVDEQRHVMSTIIAIGSVQLVLLAVWMLVGVLLRSGEARRPEIRVARLRGFPASTMLTVTAAEPAALCAAGAVVGIVLAWLAVLVARDSLLNRAAVITPDLWVFVALGLALLAIAAALGVGTVRLLRSSGLSDSPPASRGARYRPGLVADAVLLMLALVALVALATSGALAGHNDPIASAAPGLIALGAAVVAVQLLLVACRLTMSATTHTRYLAVFLAMSQVVRRPVILRQARVLIIAFCLACFAVSAWSVARGNRVAAARFTVGTSSVATVTPHGVALERAVRRVDPRGRFAMAAVTISTASSTVLAVDSERLGVAFSWPGGLSRSSLQTVTKRLHPATAPPVSLAAAPLRVSASAGGTQAAATHLGDLEFAAWVFSPQGGTIIVDLGTLRPGTYVYRTSLAAACPDSCTLTGIGIVPAENRPVTTSGTIDLDVTALANRSPSGSWVPVRADMFADGWRSGNSSVSVSSAAGALRLTAPASVVAGLAGAVGSTTPPLASPADHPAVIPAVVTADVAAANGGLAGSAVSVQGLDGGTFSANPAVTSSALPRVGDQAVMVDLSLLGRIQINPTSPDATDQVWLGPAAPAHVLAQLRAAGLRVDVVQTASATFAQLQRSGPALADDFLLLAAIVALLAAAASTLGALGATVRQRATELTALEIVGVRRRTLWRSLALEGGVLATTALFGAGAGALGAAMAIPSLPELTGQPIIPLQYALPPGLITGVSATGVAVILLTTAAIGAVLIRRMSPLLLRTAPNDTAG